MRSADSKSLESTLKTWNFQRMSIWKLLLKILTVSSVPMLLHSVLNLLFSASDKRWTSSILKLKRSTLQFWKQCPSLKNTSNSQWATSTQLLSEKLTFKFQILNGKISEDFNKRKNNSKKWSCSQSSIQRNSWNSECSHQREFFSMDHQDAERPYWLRQLQMSAVPTSFQSKALSFWLCGSVRVKQMLEMCLIKLVLLLHAFFSSINLIPLQFQEDLPKEMPEVQETELSTSYLLRWTESVLKRIFSS